MAERSRTGSDSGVVDAGPRSTTLVMCLSLAGSEASRAAGVRKQGADHEYRKKFGCGFRCTGAGFRSGHAVAGPGSLGSGAGRAGKHAAHAWRSRRPVSRRCHGARQGACAGPRGRRARRTAGRGKMDRSSRRRSRSAPSPTGCQAAPNITPLFVRRKKTPACRGFFLERSALRRAGCWQPVCLWGRWSLRRTRAGSPSGT